MANKPVAALLYDFDHTLSPKDMQEYAFIPGVGLSAGDFWAKCNALMVQQDMDQILAYMRIMVLEARGKMLLTREEFRKLGRRVSFFPGVSTWFSRVNSYAESLGLQAEHYIISSGLKEIIEGTEIAGEFKKIYAAAFCYDDCDVAVWPAMAVNYTSKTQFLFRVNKGVLDVTEHKGLNEFTPEDERPVPFRNMVYIGDGLTDVPCMKLVKTNGGHSIAVYSGKARAVADRMLREGRVDYVLPADYSKGHALEKAVFLTLDQIAATSRTVALHLEHEKQANKSAQN